jgi:hypothetical protein
VEAVSPGFEVNDAGFQHEADRVRLGTFLTRNWLTPSKFARSGRLGLVVNQPFNFGGDRFGTSVGLSGNVSRHDFSSIYLDASLRFSGLEDRATRGGPLIMAPANLQLAVHYLTDQRGILSLMAGGSYNTGGEGWNASAFTRLNVQSRSRLTFSATPSLQVSRFKQFYLGAYSDPTATATFQNRYVFAPLRQNVFSLATRLNYYFTPALSLQFYAEPFVATGAYGTPGAFAAPRTFRFNRYGLGGSTYSKDPSTGAVTVDADGAGPSPETTFPNPEFLIRSIRSNLVLRWEYRPGSTLFLVWNQSRSGFDAEPRFRLFNNLGKIFDDNMQNVLLVKANYYLSF